MRADLHRAMAPEYFNRKGLLCSHQAKKPGKKKTEGKEIEGKRHRQKDRQTDTHTSGTPKFAFHTSWK